MKQLRAITKVLEESNILYDALWNKGNLEKIDIPAPEFIEFWIDINSGQKRYVDEDTLLNYQKYAYIVSLCEKKYSNDLSIFMWDGVMTITKINDVANLPKMNLREVHKDMLRMGLKNGLGQPITYEEMIENLKILNMIDENLELTEIGKKAIGIR